MAGIFTLLSCPLLCRGRTTGTAVPKMESKPMANKDEREMFVYAMGPNDNWTGWLLEEEF